MEVEPRAIILTRVARLIKGREGSVEVVHGGGMVSDSDMGDAVRRKKETNDVARTGRIYRVEKERGGGSWAALSWCGRKRSERARKRLGRWEKEKRATEISLSPKENPELN